MFDCQLTINGKTGKVSQFMVDNVDLYPKVKRHVTSCAQCDPTEALRFYLNRRLTLDKFKPKPNKIHIRGVDSHTGQLLIEPATETADRRLTGTLAKLALSYERESKKTRPIPQDLVNEFIWRSGDWNLIDKHEGRLSIRDLVAAAKLVRDAMPSAHYAPTVQSKKFGFIMKLVFDNALPRMEQELEDLIVVAEVTFG